MNQNLINYWATLCESIIPSDNVDEARRQRNFNANQMSQFKGGYGLAYRNEEGHKLITKLSPAIVQNKELLKAGVTAFTSTKGLIARQCNDNDKTRYALDKLHDGIVVLFRCNPGQVTAQQILDLYNSEADKKISIEDVVELGDGIQYDKKVPYEFFAINFGNPFTRSQEKSTSDVPTADSDIDKLKILIQGAAKQAGVDIVVDSGSKSKMSEYFFDETPEFEKLPEENITLVFASSENSDESKVKEILAQTGLQSDDVVKVGSDVEFPNGKIYDAYSIKI